MTEVIIFCEGPTEEQVVKHLIAPSVWAMGVYLKPQTLRTSQESRGGAVTFDRLKFYARNTLRQRNAPVLSTFLDLYALDTDFPGFAEAGRQPEVYSRVRLLENQLHAAIVEHAGCRPDRFVPHIQPYELEGLLFSDVKALVSVEPDWAHSVDALSKVLAGYETPEHINDGYETKPSRRLESMLRPSYRKTRHGPIAAQRITLAVIEEKCPHFRSWMEKLRALRT